MRRPTSQHSSPYTRMNPSRRRTWLGALAPSRSRIRCARAARSMSGSNLRSSSTRRMKLDDARERLRAVARSQAPRGIAARSCRAASDGVLAEELVVERVGGGVPELAVLHRRHRARGESSIAGAMPAAASSCSRATPRASRRSATPLRRAHGNRAACSVFFWVLGLSLGWPKRSDFQRDSPFGIAVLYVFQAHCLDSCSGRPDPPAHRPGAAAAESCKRSMRRNARRPSPSAEFTNMIDSFLTEEQRMIRDAAREFATEVLAPNAAPVGPGRRSCRRRRHRQMGELGLLGMIVPAGTRRHLQRLHRLRARDGRNRRRLRLVRDADERAQLGRLRTDPQLRHRRAKRPLSARPSRAAS